MIRRYTSNSLDKDKVGGWLALLNSKVQWPVRYERVVGENFQARLTRFDFGGLLLLSHRSSPVVIDRRAPPPGEGAGSFSLNLVTRGRLTLEHHGRCNTLGDGDMVLADSGAPSRLVFEETTHILTVRIPAPFLVSHLPRPAPLCNRRLGREHDFTAALRAALQSLLSMGRKGAPEELQRMSIQPFLGLLALTLLANHGACLQEAPVAAQRLARIRQYIDEHLTDACLGPDQIAATFNISPRYLRKLFAADGDSVSRYIQRRRLQRSADRMANPSWKERSITEICLDCGFNSPPHFTRAFKAQFGVTPQEYRRRGGGASTMLPN